jgi:hypothetical protein
MEITSLPVDQYTAISEEISDGLSSIDTLLEISSAEREQLRRAFVEEQLRRVPTNIDLSSVGQRTLLALAADQSYVENMAYHIYYDAAIRHHQFPYRYIGLYADGLIWAVGCLQHVVYCDYQNGLLIHTGGMDSTHPDDLSPEDYSRIIRLIEDTPRTDLRRGYKFTLVDTFHPTCFIHSKHSPLRGKKYITLGNIAGFIDQLNAEQLASFLKGKSWD